MTDFLGGMLVRRFAGADTLANAAQLWVVPAKVKPDLAALTPP